MKKLIVFLFFISFSQPALCQTLRLTSPNGGEEFIVGDTIVITWDGISASDTVSLEYSIDKGITWNLISDKVTGLQYTWKNIIKPIRSECLFRVQHTVDNGKIPTIEWQKRLGGNGDDIGYTIVQTIDGGYILAGYTYSGDGDVLENRGYSDFWVVKLSPFGVIEWTKVLGGSGLDLPYSIKQTTDGGYVVTGFTSSSDGDVVGKKGGRDFWVVKLTNSGVIEWQRTLGGYYWDAAYSISQTKDGGYIVAGQVSSGDGDITNYKGNGDFWVVKLSSLGTIEWQKTLGGSQEEQANSVQQTLDGGYIVAGFTASSNGDVQGFQGLADFWIIKLANNGVIEWQKSLGGEGYEQAFSIQQTFDKGYIVAGLVLSNESDVSGNIVNTDYWIVKLSENGTVEWQRTLGGSKEDYANEIQQTSDSGFIVCGGAKSTDGNVSNNRGNSDFWIVKLTQNGTIEWQKTLGGSGADVAQSIKQTLDGGYIVVGYTASDDGDVTSAKNSYDFWVVKLYPAGNQLQQDVSDGVFSSIAPSITLQSATTEAFVGDTIEIPITISKGVKIALAGITAFSVEVVFNKSLLFPVNPPNSYEEGNTLVIKLDSLRIPIGTTIELTRLKCIAALGDAEQTELTLRNVTTHGGIADITIINGVFTLKGVCKEGGSRLVNGLSQTSLVSAIPTFGGEGVEVVYTNSDSHAEFIITDILGKPVSITALLKTQYGHAYIDTSLLPVGQYFGTFRTETVRQNTKMCIIR